MSATMLRAGRHYRWGWSATEVAVAVAIGGVLTALLIPGVQRIRARAALMQCKNNIKQLALGALEYESSRGCLPPGYLGNLPREMSPADRRFWRAQWVGLNAFLLAHVGYEAAYRSLSIDWALGGLGRPWFEDEGNMTVARTKISQFICPADSPYENDGPTIECLGVSAGRGGRGTISIWMHDWDGGDDKLGRTNYVGVAGAMGSTGAPEITKWEGVFANRSSVSVRSVSDADGTSHVLFMGECLGGSFPGRRDHAFAWLGVGVTSAAWGLGDGSYKSFGSKHSGVVNFAFCDGSVRGLRSDIDRSLFLRLTAFHDGAGVGLAGIGD